ncbi:MAG: hypothetical protein KAI47_08865, partial [Deltaproteobacteria bacterium]|nr:hypothetical protein [Deltaproteobacteria bacterium]
GGCARSSTRAQSPLEKGLLELSHLALSDGLLGEEKQPFGETKGIARADGEARRRLDRLSRRLRDALGGEHGAGAIPILNRVIFAEEAYRREVDDKGLRYTLLPTVLDGRRGGCLGLSALYLVLGERLGIPLRGVVVPGHFFVRYVGPGGRRNVELLKKGRAMAARWYRRKYPARRDNSLYFRTSLDGRQTLAVYRYNVANAYRRRHAWRKALALYRATVEVLPGFAEAQGNLGLTLAHLGDLDGASKAYRRAGEANPNLPGLRKNLEALAEARGLRRKSRRNL